MTASYTDRIKLTIAPFFQLSHYGRPCFTFFKLRSAKAEHDAGTLLGLSGAQAFYFCYNVFADGGSLPLPCFNGIAKMNASIQA